MLHDQRRLEPGNEIFVMGQQHVPAAGTVLLGQREQLGVGGGLGRLTVLVIFEQRSHLAFIEEREHYVGVVADFLARADRDAQPGS